MNKFWIVWEPTSRQPPVVRHRTFEDATKESQRLARLAPGKEFFVCEAQRVSKRVEVETVDLEENIPF